MIDAIFLVVAGIMALSIQSSVVGLIIPAELRPDLALIVVAWSTGRIKFPVGICFSFMLGLCMDVMSGTPTGLLGLLLMITYIFLGYVDSYMEVTGVARNYISIFLASAILFSAIFFSRALAGETDLGWPQFYWIIVKSISTASFSWVVLKFLNFSWNEYSKLVGTV